MQRERLREFAARRPRSLPRIASYALLAVGTAALAYEATVSAIANVTRSSAPERALRAQPRDALAKANLASLLLLTNANESRIRTRATDLAKQSLAALPLNPVALRIVALSQELNGQNSAAIRSLRLSERLSRRDAATQLMLIENEVQRGSVEGALHHYDQVLRTNPDMGQLLFPVLAGAGSGENPDPAFIRLFRSDPPWLSQFVAWSIDYAPDLSAQAALLGAIPSGSPAMTNENRQGLIAKLVASHRYGHAFQLSRGWRAGSRGLWDFGGSFPLPPLDWRLSSSGDISTNLFTDDEGSPALSYEGRNAADIVAERVVALPSGRYRFVATGTSNVDDGATAPRWAVYCAGGSESFVQCIGTSTWPASP